MVVVPDLMVASMCAKFIATAETVAGIHGGETHQCSYMTTLTPIMLVVMIFFSSLAMSCGMIFTAFFFLLSPLSKPMVDLLCG